MGGAEYMKSIKKYETIINEALRSALEYDTPEGQINETGGNNMGVSNTVQQLSVFLENISGLTEFIFLRMTRSIM